MGADRTLYGPARCGWLAGRPTSAAVRAGELVFVSGQVALDEDGRVESSGDVAAQARLAFERIQRLVEEAGGGMGDVVDLMSFHTDPREMDAVFEVARDFFAGDYPAWTPVGTIGLQAPGLAISIRAIAHLGAGEKRCVTPDTISWWRTLPMSAACRKGELIFVSGQVAADADGFVTVPGDHAAQARFSYDRIAEVVGLLGGSMHDVIDVISFHQDPRGMIPAAEVQRAVFADVPRSEVAAWTAIATPHLYRLGMLSSFKAIADLRDGPRIAQTPESIWWKIDPISGGTRKTGGNLIGLSGQVASDGGGLITTPGDTAAQGRIAFDRLREVLELFGASMDAIVEVTSFHKDVRGWEVVMEVGQEYFGDDGPAWTPVGSTGLFQEGYLHEIYALAVV